MASKPGQIQDKCEKKAVLYVVGTPIGNLSDFTFRAIEVLKSVDCLLCEDTRETAKLLHRYGIEKKLFPIPAQREKRETQKVLQLLSQGKSVALLSDAGTPAISDPGNFMVHSARNEGFVVKAVPGCSAVTSAVSISGLCNNGFLFLGFLHRRKARMKNEFLQCKKIERPIVFFESPYRILQTLKVAEETLGRDALCWVGRELTKKFEEQFSGTLEQVIEKLEGRAILGEVTAILKP